MVGDRTAVTKISYTVPRRLNATEAVEFDWEPVCPGGESWGISIGIFSRDGRTKPRTKDSAAAAHDTNKAWTCNNSKFPRIRGCRDS